MSRKKKSEEIQTLKEIECDDISISESFTSGAETIVLEPKIRMKALADSGNAFEVDHNIPPRRYYRSGLEMLRMADVYLKEGSLENAYILYMKFMTLFLEKIRKHPDFKSVSVVDRAQNDAKLKEVLPKAEQLKLRLLNLYEKEHKLYLRHTEELKIQEKKKLEEQQKKESETLDSSDTEKSNAGRNIKPKGDTDRRPGLLRPLSQINVTLRDIIVPSKLTSKFLILAIRNTEQNKETCGILAGVLQRDQLFISHLLIPKQVGTSDSCSTECDEEIFMFQDEHDLLTLGWIHTHPTQTAFLSSVDLHTHCSYQLMMPEALAVVCAPKNEETGFFQLTPEYGLDVIANCRQAGFHPHPTEPPLYRKAEHVKLEDTPIEVVDLRRR